MAFWDSFLSSGIEGAAKGIGSLAKDLRSAITGEEVIPAGTKIALEEIAARLEEGSNRVEIAALQAVNQTMQAESKSEHWMQWAWRPFVGFIFGITFVGVYFVLPLAKIVPPEIPANAWLMIGAVLGVASWHRGAQKREQAKNK
jgi:hypothetical protein